MRRLTARLIAALRPPIFPDDEEKTRQAFFLNILILLDVSLALTIPLAAWLFGKIPWTVVLSANVFAFFYLLIRRWMFRGAVEQVGLAISITIVISITHFLTIFDTIHSPLTALYLLVAITSGIVLNTPSFLLVLAFIMLNVGGLAWAEGAGLLAAGPLPRLGSQSDWLVTTGMVLVTGLFAYGIRRTVTSALQRASRELAARARVEEVLRQNEAALRQNEAALRQNEAALRRSRDFYQGILNGMDDPVMVKDVDGRWLLLNDSACQMFGIRRDDWIGRTDAEVDPEHVDFYAALDQEVLQSQTALVFEEISRPKNGAATFALTTKKSLITNPSTGEQFITSVSRDISERKRMEDDLQAAREHLEQRVAEQTAALRQINETLSRSMQELEGFMDANPGLVFMFRQDWQMIRWNRRFEEVLGYTREDVEKLKIHRIMNRGDVRDLIRNPISTSPGGLISAQVTLRAKDGRAIPVFASGSVFTGDDGLRYIIGVGIDISDRLAAEEALRESEARYRALIESIPDVIIVMDTEGTILYANSAMAAICDTEMLAKPQDPYHSSFASILHPADVEHVVARFDAFAESREQTSEVYECRLIDREGKTHWFSGRFARIQLHGKPAVQILGHEITSLIETQEALRRSEERYALAAEGANDGLWDMNLTTRQVYVSPRFREMVCAPEMDEYISYDWFFDRIHPDEIERAEQAVTEHLRAAGQPRHFQTEFRLLCGDGQYHWMLMRGTSVRGGDGAPTRAAGSITDITERKRVEDQLLHDAFHDLLTGLPNRSLLCDRLEQAILQRARRPGDRFAVLFMDLDRFKYINDSHGHPVGDRLLISAARRVQGCIRAGDTLARLGGDEFVILQTGITDHLDAVRLAERVQNVLSQPFDLGGLEIVTSTSIGIVLADNTHHDPEDLLRDADIAMYRAKANGRARYEIFDAPMRSQVFQRIRMEADLRLALQNREFEVFYHPILAVVGGAFFGFEALVRWRHPMRGLVPPGEFIPLAEEIGLIIPLDRWVLREACRQVAEWRRVTGADIRVSVNLSGRQFSQPDLVDSIRAAMRETGIEPRSLLIEITESAIMENITEANQTLRLIRSLGVQVEIDDFGTGFSSLTYLVQLPVDVLKIDRSFTTQLGYDGRKSEIVDTVIRLAHNLNLNVVAEGVETLEQLAALRSMDCDYAQGYLYAQPLSAPEAEVWLGKKLKVPAVT